jgi:hypothetical protein
MNDLTAFSVAKVLVVLILCHALVLTIHQPRRWQARARSYRVHQSFSIALFVIGALIFGGGLIFSKEGQADAPATAASSTAQVVAYGSVFTVFFLGIVRAAIDTRWAPNGKRFKTILDAFLVGLLATVTVDVVLERLNPTGQFIALLSANVTTGNGFVGLLICGVTYVAWVHSLLIRQLSLVDEFSGPVVRRFMRHPFASETPFQVVLIGPKHAGKSKIEASVTDREYGTLLDSPGPQIGTMVAQLSDRRRVAGAVIDTPGENIGQHLGAAINYRTDVIVLVVNAGSLAKELKHKLPARENIAGLIDGQARYLQLAIGRHAANYLEVLFGATAGTMHNNKGAGQEAEALRVLYKVHRFCLVVYNVSSRSFDSADTEALEMWSRSLGALFGVDESHCRMAVLNTDPQGGINLKSFADKVVGMALD